MPPKPSPTATYRNRPRPDLAEALAVGGLLAFALTVGLEHVLEPALNPLRHQVSEYANSPSGAVMVLGFALWAISLSATAFLVGRRWRDLPLSLALALAGLGIAIAALFATETVAGELPPGAALTTTGKLHDLGSGLAALALIGGALIVAFRARAPVPLRKATLWLLPASLILSLALLLTDPSVGGLRQRLLLLVGCVWQLMLLSALPDTATGRSRSSGATAGTVR
jgi:hypothetical protein